MKWVRCIYCGLKKSEEKSYGYSDGYITAGEIYKVTEYLIEHGEEYVKIINNYNNESNSYYAIWAGNKKWFEDVTDEIRDNKINSILNE
jgi:hypothetical protein